MFRAFRTLAPELCARLTQIDYEREIVLVALDPTTAADDSFSGVVHLAADPDRQRAEYAILVRSDLKGQGLGTALTHATIDYAEAEGIGELFATVLHENRTMLDLADRLGFAFERQTEGSDAVELRLLREEAA